VIVCAVPEKRLRVGVGDNHRRRREEAA
jgi:hypothetical protein